MLGAPEGVLRVAWRPVECPAVLGAPEGVLRVAWRPAWERHVRRCVGPLPGEPDGGPQRRPRLPRVPGEPDGVGSATYHRASPRQVPGDSALRDRRQADCPIARPDPDSRQADRPSRGARDLRSNHPGKPGQSSLLSRWRFAPVVPASRSSLRSRPSPGDPDPRAAAEAATRIPRARGPRGGGCPHAPTGEPARTQERPVTLCPDPEAAEAAPRTGRGSRTGAETPTASHPGCGVQILSRGLRVIRVRGRKRQQRLMELGCPSEHQRRGTDSVWPSSTRLQPLSPPRRAKLTLGVFPRPPRSGPDGPNTSVSLGLTLSYGDSPFERSLSRASRSRPGHGTSPHEVPGPYSTSRQGDPPARVSTPAVFRLRRWSGLGGLLPPWPCRLVSSGGTLGVPGAGPSEDGPTGCRSVRRRSDERLHARGRSG